jgi:replicative DNA helicase
MIINNEMALVALLLNYPEYFERLGNLPNIFKHKACNYIYRLMQEQINYNKNTVLSVINKSRVISRADFDEVYEYYFTEEEFHGYVEYLKSEYTRKEFIKQAKYLESIDYISYEKQKERIDKVMAIGESTKEDRIYTGAEIIDKMQRAEGYIGNTVKSQIPYIDCNGGYEATDYVIIAARSSTGKTTYVLNLITQDLVEGKKVGLVSSEVDKEKVMSILACTRAQVPEIKYRTSRLDKNEIDRIAEAYYRLQKENLYLVDTSNILLNDLWRKAREFKELGVEKIYIDYLTYIKHYDKNLRGKYETVSHISEQLKVMAKELKIPVICIAQLNRKSESEGREPRKSDLRDSGAIEQDADIIILLHCEKDNATYLIDEGDKSTTKLKHIVDKYRNGPTGEYWSVFNRSFRRIRHISNE